MQPSGTACPQNQTISTYDVRKIFNISNYRQSNIHAAYLYSCLLLWSQPPPPQCRRHMRMPPSLVPFSAVAAPRVCEKDGQTFAGFHACSRGRQREASPPHAASGRGVGRTGSKKLLLFLSRADGRGRSGDRSRIRYSAFLRGAFRLHPSCAVFSAERSVVEEGRTDRGIVGEMGSMRDRSVEGRGRVPRPTTDECGPIPSHPASSVRFVGATVTVGLT